MAGPVTSLSLTGNLTALNLTLSLPLPKPLKALQQLPPPPPHPPPLPLITLNLSQRQPLIASIFVHHVIGDLTVGKPEVTEFLDFEIVESANAVSFHRYRGKNLRPFRSPIDESVDVLANFTSLPGSEEEGFFFGLATAPAHVEDRLDDAWLQFAEEHPSADSENMKNSQQADALMASVSADGGSQQASLAKDEPKSAGVKVTKMPLKISMEAMIRRFEKYLEEEEDKECSHTVATWDNVLHPQERLRFWFEPDIELKLAKDTDITVFRMGLDWTWIMPKKPKDGLSDT